MIRLLPLALIAACNCTANIDATFESTPSEAQVCEAEQHAEVQAAKLRARDAVIDETLQVGAEVPEAGTQKVVISALDESTRVMTTITSSGTVDHDATGGSNQITHLWLQATGGYDTTTNNGVNRALEITAACSVTTGAGSCEDFGVISDAANGYSWYSSTGSMRQQGAVSFGPGAVDLGDNVVGMNLPGTAGTATQMTIGWAADSTPGNVNSGTGLAVKNAQNGVTVGGISIALDTTIAATIRGGLIMTRGASGGTGSGLSSGLVFAGGSGFPFVASAANELTLYDELGAGIVFGADNTGYTSAFRLTPKNHIAIDTSTGAPARSAGCTSGTGAAFVGNDIAMRLTTGSTSTACTLTFDETFTVIPICTVTPEAGAAMPTFTTSATAITMTVNASAATYNIHCIGQPGST